MYNFRRDKNPGETPKPPSRSYGYNLVKSYPELQDIRASLLELFTIRASRSNNTAPKFTLFRKVVETNSIPLDLTIILHETPLRFVRKQYFVVMSTSSSIQPVIPTPWRALNATVTLAVGMTGTSFQTQLLCTYRRILNDFELLSKANVILDANGTDSQSEKTVREYMISTLLPSIIDYRNTFHNSSKPSLTVSDDRSNRVSIHFLEFFNQNNIISYVFLPTSATYFSLAIEDWINCYRIAYRTIVMMILIRLWFFLYHIIYLWLYCFLF